MSVSTSTDPVQAIIDILTGTAAAEWTTAGAKPAHIERQEETSQNMKGNRSDDAIYVNRSADTSMNPLGAEVARVDESSLVNVDVWTLDSSAQAEAIGGDVKRILFQYANDNHVATEFGRIRPETVADVRGETIPTQADHYREIFAVRLRGLRDPSTY